MIKMIALFNRKQGWTLEKAYSYWLDTHASLVKKHAKTLRIRKYVQSLKIPSEMIDKIIASRGGSGKDYDGLAEVWYEDDAVAAFNTPEGRAATEELMQDDAVFQDSKNTVFFMSEERPIFDNTLDL